MNGLLNRSVTTVLIAFFVGCASGEKEKKKSLLCDKSVINMESKKLGLAEISESWIEYKMNDSVCSWIDKSKSTVRNGIKRVSYNDGSLLTISDVYYGPNFYESFDGKFQEKVFLKYRYDSELWEATYNGKLNGDIVYIKNLSLKKADSIINKWKKEWSNLNGDTNKGKGKEIVIPVGVIKK